MAFLKKIETNGTPADETKFRKLRGDLYELKRGHYRFTCYRTHKGHPLHDDIVLLHGFKKETRATPRSEIRRGLCLLKEVKEYLDSQG